MTKKWTQLTSYTKLVTQINIIKPLKFKLDNKTAATLPNYHKFGAYVNYFDQESIDEVARVTNQSCGSNNKGTRLLWRVPMSARDGKRFATTNMTMNAFFVGTEHCKRGSSLTIPQRVNDRRLWSETNNASHTMKLLISSAWSVLSVSSAKLFRHAWRHEFVYKLHLHACEFHQVLMLYLYRPLAVDPTLFSDRFEFLFTVNKTSTTKTKIAII